MEINATPVKKEGKIIALQGLMRDITERKKAEEELKKYKKNLEEMIKTRTDELKMTNERLWQDIIKRKKAKKVETALYKISEATNLTRNIDDLFLSIHKIVAELMDGWDYLDIGAKPMKKGEVHSMVADIEKAEKLLEWKPITPLREGLKRTIDWWTNHTEFWR